MLENYCATCLGSTWSVDLFLCVLTYLTSSFQVLCGWIFWDLGDTGIWEDWRRYKSSSLGMPKAPQVNISRSIKHLCLGMLRIPPLFINNYRLAHDDHKFLFVHMCYSWSIFCAYYSFLFYAPWWYDIILGLFIECFMRFT